MTGVALVTGGAGSIGRAIGRRLAAQGLHVLLADVVPPAEMPEGCAPEPLDVRDAGAIAALLDRATQAGPLAALVLAHGILRETPPLVLAEAPMREVLDINLEGVARVLALAAPRMADGGAIVTLSSVTAAMGRTQAAVAYQASKAGVESLTRSYAVALAPRGVRVNCVAPGYLSVPMAGDGAMLRARQGGNAALTAFTPFGRLVTPEEVAAVAAFLCAPGSSGVSGVVLPVDGAQRAW
ncbi:SDR family NAD(P)-dependent oxidoreductase [Roseomonas sp. AR75]|uniref:SDR family NAD(P)-dependent oxidoreductase n=1 Tax=Roseomonas sp. AR75 TaxID=2562311 RepID=UPI0010C000A5|nr:SDR family oxidoreductase [Roseomonas sp. AR75]